MRRRDTLTLAISGTALVTSVLVVGGALRWTQAIVAALIALALAVQLSSRRSLDRVSPLLVLLGTAIGLTAIQLVPLPAGVLDALDPTGMSLRDSGAALANTSPWHCISLDPAATLRSLAFFVTLFGVATLSLRFASSERGRYLLVAGVTLTCGLAAAVTGLHLLVSATDLYGLYSPVHAAPPVLGPLLNANHLGCLMAFGAVLAIGLMFYERQASQMRVLWTVIALGCALVTFASESRGATIALALGVVITVALLVGRRLAGSGESKRQRKQGLMRDLPIAVVMAISLAIALYTTAGKVADQLENTTLSELSHPLSKFEAWKSSIDLVAETPWVGVGRGAVESTLTRVHEASAYVTFSHLENEYVSAIVEWGIPGALVLALVLGWCMVTAMRRWRDGALVAGALGALAAVMFQSSVDFGIEMIGIAIPVTAVAATVLLVPFRQRSHLSRARIGRGLLIGGLAAACVVLLTPATRSLQEDHDDIQSAEHLTLTDLCEDIQRHPLDYFGFARAADLLTSSGNATGVAFLNHALELHPTHPGLHRLAARMLISNHRPRQAALEYATAMRGTLLPKPLLTEIVAVLKDPKSAASAIPSDSEFPNAILNTLKELGRQDVSVKWLEHVIQKDSYDTATIDVLYDLATGLGDLDAAQRAAERRLQIAHTYVSRLMLARIELLRHDYAPILADLADVATWHSRIDVQGDAWLLRCDALLETDKIEEASECVHRLDGSGLMATRRSALVKRLRAIDAKRASALVGRAIQDADHLPQPPQIELSRPPGQTPASPTITNPLTSSPLQK